MAGLLSFTLCWRLFTVSEYHDECFGDSDFDPTGSTPSVQTPVLLEVKQGDCWEPVRIAREFPNVRAALDALPMFARQQCTDLDNVRLFALRTETLLRNAEEALIERHRDDPRR
jgi:hypothetical protein